MTYEDEYKNMSDEEIDEMKSEIRKAAETAMDFAGSKFKFNVGDRVVHVNSVVVGIIKERVLLPGPAVNLLSRDYYSNLLAYIVEWEDGLGDSATYKQVWAEDSLTESLI